MPDGMTMLNHMSIWEKACRKRMKSEDPFETNVEGDWTNLSTVIFKAGQI